MKKKLYMMIVGGVLLTSSTLPVCATENLVEETGLSITLVRKLTQNQVPGVNGDYSASSTPQINRNNKLPQTNDYSSNMYPFLGFLLIGCSWIIWCLKDRKEEK